MQRINLEGSRTMALRDALRLARTRGFAVNQKRGTGELHVWSADRRRHVTLNGRKKDAPRNLMALLRTLGRGVSA